MGERIAGGHISHLFDKDLEAIKHQALKMGGLVEMQVENSLLALLNADSVLAEQVAGNDYQINAIEVAIDEECNRIIALRQPAANDLRLVLSMMKTITDLERVGDEAEKIGRYAIKLAACAPKKNHLNALQLLGEQVRFMLRSALDALARMDSLAAYKTAVLDKQVNNDYDILVQSLSESLGRDPELVESTLGILWCARSLERIGDHTKNLCEHIVFAEEGRDIRHGLLAKALEDNEDD